MKPRQEKADNVLVSYTKGYFRLQNARKDKEKKRKNLTPGLSRIAYSCYSITVDIPGFRIGWHGPEAHIPEGLTIWHSLVLPCVSNTTPHREPWRVNSEALTVTGASVVFRTGRSAWFCAVCGPLSLNIFSSPFSLHVLAYVPMSLEPTFYCSSKA